MTLLLEGLCVLNTRPVHQASELTNQLEALGAQVIHCPSVEIVPLSFPTRGELTSADMVIFVSPNAVKYYFEQADLPPNSFILAIGPGTAAALAKKKFNALTPPSSHTESLLTLPCLQSIQGKKIKIIKGKAGRTLLEDTLKARGAQVEALDVYERIMPHIAQDEIEKIWREDRIDIILFTSQQGMEQLFALFGQAAQSWLKSKPCLVISQRLAEHAKKIGIKTLFLTSPSHIVQGLTNAFEIIKSERKEKAMNEQQINPSVSTSTTEPPTPPQSRPSTSLGMLFLLLFILITGLIGGYALYLTYANHQTLTELQTSMKQSYTRTKELEMTLATLSEAHAGMQNELSSFIHQINPTTLTQDQLFLALEQARDYLELAQIESKWQNNASICVMLLNNAKKILQHTHNDELKPIIQAIDEAQEKISLEPKLHLTALFKQFHQLENALTALTPSFSLPVSGATTSGTQPTNLDNAFDSLKRLIVIQKQGTPGVSLTATTFIDRILIALQIAKLAILQHNSSLYEAALQQARQDLNLAFGKQPELEQKFTPLLDQLLQVQLSSEGMEVNKPLELLKQWMVQHGKPVTAADKPS